MSYRDDQCEECGAVRVAGSKLCVGCMVRMITRLEDRIANKMEDVEALKRKNEMLKQMFNEVIAHGFKQNREVMKLNQYIKMLERELKRRMQDEKDRQGEDTEGQERGKAREVCELRGKR